MPSTWSEVEDARLMAMVEEAMAEDVGNNTSNFRPRAVLWKQVAEKLGTGRTPAECLGRWSLFNPNIVTEDWTEAEDLALIESIKRTPITAMGWSRRATELAEIHGYGGSRRRSGQDVCRRWLKHLSRSIDSSQLVNFYPLHEARAANQMHAQTIALTRSPAVCRCCRVPDCGIKRKREVSASGASPHQAQNGGSGPPTPYYPMSTA
jgi:hypothetical protein